MNTLHPQVFPRCFVPFSALRGYHTGTLNTSTPCGSVQLLQQNGAYGFMALGDNACSVSLPPPELRWRAPAGVSNVRLYSTCTRNTSPLRAFALGGDSGDVYAERGAHKYSTRSLTALFRGANDLSNGLKSHGSLAHHTDESIAAPAPLSRYTAASRRGPASLSSDERFHICNRTSFGALCAFLGQYCATAAHFVLADYFGMQRFRRASERTETHARGLGGVLIGSADSEGAVRTRLRALGWRDAREGQRWVQIRGPTSLNSRQPAVRLRYRGERVRARTERVAACEEARSPSGGDIHSVVFFAAAHIVCLEVDYPGVGVTSGMDMSCT
ncbi:hypothetical protein FB451DRAFT_1373331 [Mycena latifolia]|nr:hypothetical protein FB451DRAFT_1373331 [Mycena latifolia]